MAIFPQLFADILQSKELQRSINLDWNYVSPVTFYYDNRNIPSEKRDQISRTLRGYYFGSRKVEASTSRNLTNLYSDRLFVWGTRTAALLMAKFIPVYTYVFGFFGEYSMIQTFYSETFQGPIGNLTIKCTFYEIIYILEKISSTKSRSSYAWR